MLIKTVIAQLEVPDKSNAHNGPISLEIDTTGNGPVICYDATRLLVTLLRRSNRTMLCSQVLTPICVWVAGQFWNDLKGIL